MRASTPLLAVIAMLLSVLVSKANGEITITSATIVGLEEEAPGNGTSASPYEITLVDILYLTIAATSGTPSAAIKWSWEASLSGVGGNFVGLSSHYDGSGNASEGLDISWNPANNEPDPPSGAVCTVTIRAQGQSDKVIYIKFVD